MTKTALTMASALVLLGGCSRDPAAQEQNKETPAATSEPVKAAPIAPVAAAETPIGIPECDEYFKQASDCFAKNPIMKAQLQDGIGSLRQSLIERAKDVENRQRLAGQCKAHTDELIKDCAK